MEKSIKNTYCNPLVLPDYPNHPALARQGMIRNNWGRGDKQLVSDREFVKKVNPEMFGSLETGARMSFFGRGGDDKRSYGKTALNDTRATADPSVVYYEGKWYLYCTQGMVYSTEDFQNWIPHPDSTWMPISDPMAPTVEVFRGKFYATANSVPLHVADNPLGPWTLVGDWILPDGREMLANDPMIFADDDGRLYLYWGLGAGILGAELDPEQPNRLITEPKVLILFNPLNWWERFGASNENWATGCHEGAWMYKRGGTYYLTYSVCGTEYYTYAMGAYVCSSPLGDFKVQPLNPVSRSRNGLIKGGGHGSIVSGPNDTVWCFYTIPVCIDATMERRIGMDPVGFDENGNMFCLTGCDTPQYIPGVLDSPEKGNAAGLDTLTIFKPAYASSFAPGHFPLYAIDEALHTWWQPAEDDKEPEFAVQLSGKYDISAVRIIWKDVGLNFGEGINPGPYKYIVECCDDLQSDDWKVIVDASQNETDLTVDYRTFETVEAMKVKLRILGAPKGLVPGLLNFTVFGEHVAKKRFVK